MRTNSVAVIADVHLDGIGKRAIRFEAGELVIDDNDCIIAISMHFSDGSIGNFFLMPKSTTEDQALRLASEGIRGLGLIRMGKVLYSGGTPISKITMLSLQLFRGQVIQSLIRDLRVHDSAYFEITTGEMVITHGMKLSDLRRA